MSETLFEILKWMKESGFMFLALITGAFAFRFFNKFYKLIFFQVVLSIVFYIGAYVILMYQASNHWMYNVYIFAEVMILLYAAQLYLSGSTRKRIVLIGIISFLSIYVIEGVTDGFSDILNITLVAAGLIVVVVYGMVMYSALHQTDFDWKMSPELWLCIGTLVYFACNVPFIGLIHQLLRYDAKLVDSLFYITEVLAAIRYLMVSVAFIIVWKQAAQRKLTL